MDLSVVVVTWNTRELTERCLCAVEDALAHCRARSGLASEVVVVDNGSRDGSAEQIRSGHPRLDLVVLDANRGFAAAANAGIARAAGRVLLLLNSDALIDSAALEACLGCLDAAPDVGVVGPQLLHADGRLQNSVHAQPSLATELLPTWLPELLLPRRFPSKRRRRSGPVDVAALKGAVFFVRREVIDVVGPLCEDYFFFLEETDWCRRIRGAGFRICLVPEARVVHLSGASSKRRDPIRTRIEFHRSLYHFMRVHRGPAAARAVRRLRTGRAAVSLVLTGVVAALSSRSRERWLERWWLLVWHWRGCPDDWGLPAAVVADAAAGAVVGKIGAVADLDELRDRLPDAVTELGGKR